MRESLTKRKERTKEIISILERSYPESGIALRYETPFQLLIATILSAQCTDERVNMVTPGLFERYPEPRDFVDAPIEELEQAIFSTGFYRNKAKSIRGACSGLIDRYDGNVPTTMEELIDLPGVGRKTANVLLGHCFGTPGLVVDTHVKRISNLLKLVNSQNAEIVERELQKIVPESKWVLFSHLLADHGRAVCIARRPKCHECPISLLCPSSQAD